MAEKKTQRITLTRGCVVDGEKREAGETLSVSRATAAQLIGYGKAEEASAETEEKVSGEGGGKGGGKQGGKAA